MTSPRLTWVDLRALETGRAEAQTLGFGVIGFQCHGKWGSRVTLGAGQKRHDWSMPTSTPPLLRRPHRLEALRNWGWHTFFHQEKHSQLPRQYIFFFLHPHFILNVSLYIFLNLFTHLVKNILPLAKQQHILPTTCCQTHRLYSRTHAIDLVTHYTPNLTMKTPKNKIQNHVHYLSLSKASFSVSEAKRE